MGVFLIYLEWSILGWIITILGGLILRASYQPVTELDYQAMLSDVKAAREQATQEKEAKDQEWYDFKNLLSKPIGTQED